MIKRLLFISSLVLIVLGCDESENDDNSIIIDETDISSPTVSISSLKDELENGLEVKTTFNITITDESDIVNTTVLVNDKEIIDTELKSFSFELNPFDYPSGENTLSIISSDLDGNKSEQNQTFEVNKLLVSIAAPTIPSVSQLFFSVNTMNGDLLAFAPVTRPLEIVKLYANDDFVPQPIVVTSYEMQPEATYKASLKSFASIEPGTDLVAFQEASNVPTENVNESQQNIRPFTITINNIENEKIANSLFAVRNNHLAIAESIVDGSNGFEAQLPYTTLDTDIAKTLIYTSSSISESRNNDFISLEEYRYLLFDNPKDSTISFLSFNRPVATSKFSIPAGSSSYSQRLIGYLDNDAYQNNEFFNVFESKGDNQTNEIEIPVISELNVVRNEVILQLENRNTFEVHTLGIKEISVPNWSAVKSENTVIVSGNYDKLETTLLTNNDPNIILFWSLTDKPRDAYPLLFDTFEFPEEFQDYALTHNLNLTNLTTNSILYTEQFSSSKSFEYEELLFYPFLPSQPEDIYILKSNLTSD